MKPFDPQTTEIRGRGTLAEAFFKYPGIKRSNHPINSVTALGKKADFYTSEHPLHECGGYGSPAWKFYQEGGYALLIGVDLCHSLTFIHLGEYLLDVDYLKHGTMKVLTVNPDGQKAFVALEKYPDPDFGGIYFSKLQDEMEKRGMITRLKINSSFILYFSFKEAIDLSIEMMKMDPLVFAKP